MVFHTYLWVWHLLILVEIGCLPKLSSHPFLHQEETVRSIFSKVLVMMRMEKPSWTRQTRVIYAGLVVIWSISGSKNLVLEGGCISGNLSGRVIANRLAHTCPTRAKLPDLLSAIWLQWNHRISRDERCYVDNILQHAKAIFRDWREHLLWASGLWLRFLLLSFFSCNLELLHLMKSLGWLPPF